MKQVRNNISVTTGRTLASLAIVASLALTPVIVFAADEEAHEDLAEERITNMHASLGITAPQEKQWMLVAKVMRDAAIEMDMLTQQRMDNEADRTAVDDLKSYAVITDAHADGLKRLIPVFTTLYAGMSDAQKEKSDTLFRRGNDESDSADSTDK